LHGEFPVVAVDGTVQTRKWQFGRVVTVSDSWFAVTSDDGYSDRYLLDTSVTSTPVKVGQDVTVVGVIESTLSTAGAEPTERVV
jgi:multidrug resistance efflux pump